MKIICLLKFVPDVNQFLYDYENNTLVRENVELVLNPDDKCALGLALKIKKSKPDTTVEVVTMAPLSIREYLKDIVRIKVDRAVLLSDTVYQGSDTYATSLILGKYLESASYDLILTGMHSLDGDTAHVPAQLAELLQIEHMSYVTAVSEESLNTQELLVTAEYEQQILELLLPLPVIVSISKESKYKLPFVRYEDLDLYVDEQITVLSNADLQLPCEKIGIAGSLTKVRKTYQPEFKKKENIVVQNDEAGIETVYQFLLEKGFL
ncbi:MAG: electron transfer flavoprotein subunit beta/FixA family protein [Lachnospiraceae bacterium]